MVVFNDVKTDMLGNTQVNMPQLPTAASTHGALNVFDVSCNASLWLLKCLTTTLQTKKGKCMSLSDTCKQIEACPIDPNWGCIQNLLNKWVGWSQKASAVVSCTRNPNYEESLISILCLSFCMELNHSNPLYNEIFTMNDKWAFDIP